MRRMIMPLRYVSSLAAPMRSHGYISPISRAKQTRWSAQVEYADHPFSCAISCAQLTQRAVGAGAVAVPLGGARAAGSCSREVIASFW
jgi:hypothetical protein